MSLVGRTEAGNQRNRRKESVRFIILFMLFLPPLQPNHARPALNELEPEGW